MIKFALVLCFLSSMLPTVVADDMDLTGTWESEYTLGPIKEVLTANIQQVGESILGSFSVEPAIGPKRSGIIFGSVHGDNITANFLSVRDSGETDPLVTLTLIEAKIVDEDTMEGTFYSRDNNNKEISGPYQAKRK